MIWLLKFSGSKGFVIPNIILGAFIYRMKDVSSNIAHGELTKFVSDLRQVAGFPRVLRFPSTIKLTATT
jgi:hypothetical protein